MYTELHNDAFGERDGYLFTICPRNVREYLFLAIRPSTYQRALIDNGVRSKQAFYVNFREPTTEGTKKTASSWCSCYKRAG